MIDGEKTAGQVVKNTADIAALWESVKSAHKRLDENDRITEGIHRLAANVEGLAQQVKLMTVKWEENVGRLETSIKSQGERIGSVERRISEVGRQEKQIENAVKRIDAIEREPAERWKGLVKQLIALAVAALFGAIVSKFV